MIIYNKKFQTKLGIDIDYYKTVSGRVKFLDRNDYGKEYKLNKDILIFEDEYRKGKEYYDNNKVKFEGAFANGKRNGFGKEYYDNGLLKFECEYSNRVKNGNGKEYNFKGNIKYEGKNSIVEKMGREKNILIMVNYNILVNI